jgi:GAF domain-containing protein
VDAADPLERLRHAALQALVDELRAMFDVGRCTLRRDLPGETFPVVHEALAAGVGSLIGDTTVSLAGQPVVRVLQDERRQVVQPDARAAFPDDPAFQAMLGRYGGMRAQIVTPVVVGGELRAIISLHELRDARAWTDEETELAARAAVLAARVLEPVA